MTGQAATDPTDASGTLLFDLAHGEWATDAARALGLRTDLLPAIRSPADVAGPLLPAAARDLGLPPGLPVATGAADTAASLLAANLPPPASPAPRACSPSAPAASSWFRIFHFRTIRIRRGTGAATNLFRSADGGTYRLAAAQNVGVTLDWVRRTLGASWDELYGTAARPWREDTPVFLPYLAGERWDHRASGGAWTGLTLAHQRDDLLRAALEGVAFLLRGKLEDLRSPARPRPRSSSAGAAAATGPGASCSPTRWPCRSTQTRSPACPAPDGSPPAAPLSSPPRRPGWFRTRAPRPVRKKIPKPSWPRASKRRRATVASYQGLPTKAPDTHVSCFVVSEGTGWAARLRRLLNTRLEEMSFRSGLAVVAAVFALTATGITLTLTVGGGHGAIAAPPATSSSSAPNAASGQSSAAAEPSPSASSTATRIEPGSQPVADYTTQPGASPTKAAPSAPSSAPPSASPWPTYRPMGLAPSHSLKSPGRPSWVDPP